MSFSNNFPTTNPTLELDFANVNALDPRITFTRSSIATVTNSLGLIQTVGANVPRFDYDPVTLAAKGLLIEEQRTNLVTYSEDFGNAAWTKTQSSITANTVVAPDGTLTGRKLVSTATTAQQSIDAASVAVISGVSYVFSIYARAGEYSLVQLRFNNAAFGNAEYATFNLSTNQISQSSGAGHTITPIGGGWYRCTVLGVATATTNAVPAINLATNPTGGRNPSITGDGTSGIFLWGAQLEAGSFATSYIPTVASQVTRNADVASVNTLSPWYNASEGTLYAEASALAVSQGFDKTLVSLSTGTAANTVEIYKNASTSSAVFYIANSSVLQAGLSIASTFLADVPVKLAGAYKTDDIAFTTKGAMPLTDSLAVIPTIDRLGIGSRGAFSSSLIWNGHIRKIAYYPLRLSSTNLQALTS
jgi:hypothetical protein